MLLVTAAIYYLFVIILIQSTEGNTRSKTITVNADGKHIFDNSSASNLNPRDCVDHNCFYSSLDQALSNLTSNVLINIMTNVRVSSIIPLVGLTNISIKGHQSPVISCDNYGGLSFISCHSLTIEGITWKGCGIGNSVSSHPVLRLYHCASITITNCTFQNSTDQVLVLSGVSGDVNINYCNFSSNKYYKGNGAAIHHSNSFNINTPLYFNIISCNFCYNEGAKGVVYLGKASKMHNHLHLQNSNFYHNKGVAIYLSNQTLHMSGNIEFHNNNADKGGGIFITNYSKMVFHKNSKVNFVSNTADRYGGAIFITNYSSVLIAENGMSSNQPIKALHNNQKFTIMVKFNYNKAKLFGGAIYVDKSNLVIGKNVMVEFNKNKAIKEGGGAIVCSGINSIATFEENSKVTFINNKASWSGGAALIHACNFTFKGSSAVMFDNNMADDGAAVIIYHFSNVIFEGNSVVEFSNNKAQKYCGAMDITNSSGSFDSNSTVVFKKNSANSFGGAMCFGNSSVTFRGNSAVEFIESTASFGGAIYLLKKCNVTFEGKSNILFYYNKANSGGAVFIGRLCNVTLKENFTVTFYHNKAHHGGAAYIMNSSVAVKGNATTIFNTNVVDLGGAIFISSSSNVMFTENSVVTFSDNAAKNAFVGNFTISLFINPNDYSLGGAIYTENYATFIIQGNSTVTFHSNNAEKCGAICIYNSTATFRANAKVELSHNQASMDGGAVCISNSNVTFEGKCTASFTNNSAVNGYGGAIYSDRYFTLPFEGNSEEILLIEGKDIKHGGTTYIYRQSNISFQENSTVKFNLNKAYNGGVICSYNKDHIVFRGNSTSIFKNNFAIQAGGVIYSYAYCSLSFKENSVANFNHNKALQGGVLYSQLNSYIRFEGTQSSIVRFVANVALEYGGAINLFNTFITFTNYAKVIFNGNRAKNGGAVYSDSSFITITKGINSNSGNTFISLSNITIAENSLVKFTNNTALQDGGSIYLSDHSNFILIHSSKVCFYHSIAGGYGGAIYAQLQSDNSLLKFNNSDVHFIRNRARTKNNSVYIGVLKSCNITCLVDSIKGIDYEHFLVATSPSKLVIYRPAKCINATDSECHAYFISNMMLGQEIVLNGCLLDYYNQPAETAQFLVTGMDQGFNISSSNYISISCNHTTQGIIVSGDLYENISYNFSLIISLHANYISESKMISINLIIQFSQCHPGFLYSQKM